MEQYSHNDVHERSTLEEESFHFPESLQELPGPYPRLQRSEWEHRVQQVQAAYDSGNWLLAERMAQEALDIADQRIASDAKERIDICCLHGRTLFGLHRFEQAAEQLKKGLEISQKLYPSGSVELLEIHFEYLEALDYVTKFIDRSVASKLLEQTLLYSDIVRQHTELGNAPRVMAELRLARAQDRMLDEQRALDYFQKATDCIEQTPINYPFVHARMHMLRADHAILARKPADAYEQYDQALRHIEAQAGQSDLTTYHMLRCLTKLSELGLELKQPSISYGYAMQALRIARSRFGNKHPYTVLPLIQAARSSRANTEQLLKDGNSELFAYGNAKLAYQFLVEANEITCVQLGDEHPYIADIMLEIGHFATRVTSFNTQENLPDPILCYSNAMEIRAEYARHEYYSVFEAYDALCEASKDISGVDSHEGTLQNLLETSKNNTGYYHPELLTRYGTLVIQRGDLQEGLRCYRLATKYFHEKYTQHRLECVVGLCTQAETILSTCSSEDGPLIEEALELALNTAEEGFYLLERNTPESLRDKRIFLSRLAAQLAIELVERKPEQKLQERKEQALLRFLQETKDFPFDEHREIALRHLLTD